MENASTYNGRMIRIEGKDEETKNLQQTVILEKDQITFGEAVKAGLIKEGMFVVFGEHGKQSSDIALTVEMTGEEQEIDFSLSMGIVMKKANDDYAIFAILNSYKNLKFQGRFARANAFSTVKYILNTISNMKISLVDIEDLIASCDNYMLCSHIKTYRRFICLRKGELVEFEPDYGTSKVSYDPGGPTHNIRSLAVNIGDNNMVCTIKDNSIITTQYLPTATSKGFNSLIPKYVYIEGVLI